MADLDFEGFWNEALVQLRNDLGEEAFSGWFSDLKYLRAGKDSIVLGIPSAFIRDKVKSSYQSTINSKLKAISGKEITLEYEVIGKSAKKEPAEAPKKEEAAPVQAVETEKPKKKREKHPNMRDDFTFDRFVIGDNNAFAANAAIAISNNPGKAYNPFLIYGGVGLGKTHLMQAIGNHIHENSENEVICTTSENFLNEYTTAIGKGSMNQFKNKFRHTDVLLIDDIQFFQEKERIQEELFHTFNQLLDTKKQLVFTCDRPPSELKKLDERLRSRFELCLKVDLQPPRYEERCAILRTTAENKKVEISNEIIDLVSKNISSNVRDLISAFNTLIAYQEIMREPVTLDIAQQKLKSVFFAPRLANLSMDNIIRVVAEYFSLSPNDLKGKKRSQNIVFPRQLAMYIGKEMTDFSTTMLGNEFGGRDHTTVMHSIDKIKAKLLTDPSLESTIDKIKQIIKESGVKY
jgi:chromosomal replication initiator protein